MISPTPSRTSKPPWSQVIASAPLARDPRGARAGQRGCTWRGRCRLRDQELVAVAGAKTYASDQAGRLDQLEELRRSNRRWYAAGCPTTAGVIS
jgi:hypothetical protein